MPETLPALNTLDFIPYLTDSGSLAEGLERKIGIYAIFDAEKQLQYVGYSRNVGLSLRQHLVRQPRRCVWLKVSVCDRPNRKLLEETRTAWLDQTRHSEAAALSEEANWTDPIDVRAAMTDDERQMLATADEATQRTLLKTVARRVEATLLKTLEDRGVSLALRFDPKLKEEGKLNLKADS